jgi:PKD repeat protein
MKRIIYLFLVMPLFLFSCESTPEASFYTNTIEPEVGQEVYFTNDSHNAVNFEWDFGDGFISNDENPSHIYTGTGSFEVTLTVVSKTGLEDIATLTLDVMIPTLLEIEVLEYIDRYVVPDASVFLYSSITDWDEHNDNNITEGFTDANGIVVFSGLDPFVYYVDVWEANHDNYDLRNEDIGFIRTSEILPHQINRFVALVDYVVTAKGTERGLRKPVIRSIQRKVDTALQPAPGSGLQDWKELYDRRVIKK